MARFFSSLTATGLQTTTYLLGIALFSIAFLVFLNSSISFVVTEVIGQKERVGDAVGTLGFADELLAVVACPLWGMLSDRIGLRNVAVIGYFIVGLSLICLVQSENVYPELLLGRLGFSLGGAACTTMVTAVLPTMVADRGDDQGKRNDDARSPRRQVDNAIRTSEDSRTGRSGSIGHGTAPSVSSELTITPHRYASHSRSRNDEHPKPKTEDQQAIRAAGASQLAGLVGLFTGAGALLALAVFLPLPTYFQDAGQTQANSVRISFYIVGIVALCVAGFIFLGLRGLPGEDNKGFAAIFSTPYNETAKLDSDGHLHTVLTPGPSYFELAKKSMSLAFRDSSIGLGYLGGFVARASSVAISLFIPLFVNAYFVREGLCVPNPDNLTDIKENCKRAYQLAAALTGIAETAALLCAPLFGWLGGRVLRGRSERPLLAAALIGVVGYTLFGFVRNPDAFHGNGGQWSLLSVILIGISQIGSIVCSLSLLNQGVRKSESPAAAGRRLAPSVVPTAENLRTHETGPVGGSPESAPLLTGAAVANSSYDDSLDRSRLQGSIAGMYSLAGGAGILLLTKAGGALFDSWSVGAPFWMMAVFNGVLAIAVLVISGAGVVKRVRRSHYHGDAA